MSADVFYLPTPSNTEPLTLDRAVALCQRVAAEEGRKPIAVAYEYATRAQLMAALTNYPGGPSTYMASAEVFETAAERFLTANQDGAA